MADGEKGVPDKIGTVVAKINSAIAGPEAAKDVKEAWNQYGSGHIVEGLKTALKASFVDPVADPDNKINAANHAINAAIMGEKSATLGEQELGAALHGNFKEANDLRKQALAAAGEHIGEKFHNGAQAVKEFVTHITGGDHVSEHAGNPQTPTVAKGPNTKTPNLT